MAGFGLGVRCLAGNAWTYGSRISRSRLGRHAVRGHPPRPVASTGHRGPSQARPDGGCRSAQRPRCQNVQTRGACGGGCGRPRQAQGPSRRSARAVAHAHPKSAAAQPVHSARRGICGHSRVRSPRRYASSPGCGRSPECTMPARGAGDRLCPGEALASLLAQRLLRVSSLRQAKHSLSTVPSAPRCRPGTEFAGDAG